MAIDSASLERRIVELGEVADLAGQGRLPWLDFTRALVDVVPGSLGSLTVSHSDASRTFLAPVGYEPEVLQSYSEHFAALNPWNDFWAKAAPGRVQISSHAAPSLRYRKTEFYEDWLMRLDGRADGIGIKMPTTDGDVLSILLHLPDTGLDKAEAIYRHILNGVSASVARAISINLMLQTMGERVAAAAALVDRLPDVALVIDTSMKIVDANAAAEACLRAGDLIGIRGSKLVLAKKRAQDWIKASFQQIALCTSLRDDRMIVQTEDGIFRLSLFAIPASALAGQTSLLQKKLCLLLIRDLGRRSETAPNLLATHYHLSAAEIRMCAELAGGSTIKDAADRLGIAWETARHRLKQIFQKTGTNRQSELVALLLRIG